jgi:hypothetical protein
MKPTGRLFVHALDTRAGAARCVDLPRLTSHDEMRIAIDGRRLDVVAGSRVLAAVDRTTFRVTRPPAPVQTAPAVTAPQKPARRSPDRGPAWLAVPAAFLVAGAAVLALRRRRPAPGGRSGGAAAGAPSGP